MRVIYQSAGIDAYRPDGQVVAEILANEDVMVEPSIFFRIRTIENEPIVTLSLVPGEALVLARELNRATEYSLDSIHYETVVNLDE
jgi:hypothetical protein